MRPTYLQLRSPKERTEYTTDPQISHHGTRLFHDSLVKTELGTPVLANLTAKSFAFAPSDRFGYYKFQLRRLPATLGPGSYDPDVQFKKLVSSPCAVKVKPLNTHKLATGLGKTYYMDGGLIIKDPHADKIYGRKINHDNSLSDLPQAQRTPRRSINTAGGQSTFRGNSKRLSLNLDRHKLLSASNGFQFQQQQADKISPYNQSQSQNGSQSAATINSARPMGADAQLAKYQSEVKTSVNQGNFSRRLLQNLEYARQWGEQVQVPTYGQFNQTARVSTQGGKWGFQDGGRENNQLANTLQPQREANHLGAQKHIGEAKPISKRTLRGYNSANEDLKLGQGGDTQESYSASLRQQPQSNMNGVDIISRDAHINREASLRNTERGAKPLQHNSPIKAAESDSASKQLTSNQDNENMESGRPNQQTKPISWDSS